MSEDSYNDEDYSDEDYYNTGTPYENVEGVYEKIFQTSKRIDTLRRLMRGEAPKGDGTYVKTPVELAGDQFINKQISSYTAIISDGNTVSRKSQTECRRILKDAVDSFLLDTLNDETVDTKDIRTLAKIYEHAIELFMGLVEGGHGARLFNANMVGSNLNLNDNSKDVKKEKSFFNFARNQ